MILNITRQLIKNSSFVLFTQYTKVDNAVLVYDLSGNLTTDHKARTFTYDAENVLRTAAGLAFGAAAYRYHADGTRREKSYAGVTGAFFYAGDHGI